MCYIMADYFKIMNEKHSRDTIDFCIKLTRLIITNHLKKGHIL